MFMEKFMVGVCQENIKVNSTCLCKGLSRMQMVIFFGSNGKIGKGR